MKVKNKKKANHIINKTLFSLKNKVENILKDKRVLFILVLTLILTIYFGRYFRKIIFITLLSLAGSFSMIYIRYIKQAYVLGVELCMFATVLCAAAYGSVIGAFVGFITIFFSFIVHGRFKYSSFVSIITLPFIGFITPFFGFLSIDLLGIVMTIVYDIIIIPLYILLGSRISSSLIFVITHLIFNYWIFRNLAPLILKFMI